MRGLLNEFTVAHLLQFFSLGEKSGVVEIETPSHRARLLVDYDRVIGIGFDDLDLRELLLGATGLPLSTRQRVAEISPRRDTPGLSLILRNLLEPVRWDLFVRRQLEQQVYPLLSTTDGAWEIAVTRCPPAPLVVSASVNSLILDGSRWESEMDALRLDRLSPETFLERTDIQPTHEIVLPYDEWLTWTACATPRRAGDIAADLACPDLTILTAVRRLIEAGMLQRMTSIPSEAASLARSA